MKCRKAYLKVAWADVPDSFEPIDELPSRSLIAWHFLGYTEWQEILGIKHSHSLVVLKCFWCCCWPSCICHGGILMIQVPWDMAKSYHVCAHALSWNCHQYIPQELDGTYLACNLAFRKVSGLVANQDTRNWQWQPVGIDTPAECSNAKGFQCFHTNHM